MVQRTIIRSLAAKRVAMAATATVISSAAAVLFESTEEESSSSSSIKKERQYHHQKHQRQYARFTNKSSISTTTTQCDASTTDTPPPPSFFARRLQTLRRIQQVETKNATLESKYRVSKKPLGEGAFGQVFLGKDRRTGEEVAIKKIWKEFTNRTDCQREMDALLHIREHGGHPHICSMRENFDEKEHFALVLDLINGGEVFEYLVENGAYSELDASRLIREVASAIDFLHGIGIVHGDLKPENLMLSCTSTSTSAIIKVVDFGCSETSNLSTLYRNDNDNNNNEQEQRTSTGTTAYNSPERSDVGSSRLPPTKALDMWSLGVILFIMLTGVHPLDPAGDATDEQLKERLQRIKRYRINLMNAPTLKSSTRHLSQSAISLLERLLEPNPNKRIQASELLDNSWIQGKTAASSKMADSDKRLSKFRHYQDHIETKVFQELLSFADHSNRRGEQQKQKQTGSLFQKAFSSLDKEQKGFLTVDDVSDGNGQLASASSSAVDGPENLLVDNNNNNPHAMDLSEFSDLLREHMVSRYFPSGHIVYREGDIGNHMYFIDSGKIEVSTRDGFRATLAHGDTFGEGGLLNENRKRSATLRTLTPVHAIQIDRECFTKYLSSSDSVLGMKLREKVNARKFGRAEYIIGQHKDVLQHIKVPMGHVVFKEGDKADDIYILSDGLIDVETKKGRKVYDVKPGELFGVQSFLMKRDRRACAKCVDPTGCLVKSMPAKYFEQLLQSNSSLEESLREIALRREFRRAVVTKLNRSFPSLSDSRGLREAFDAIDLDKSGQLSIDEVRDLLLNHLGADATISDREIEKLLETMDLQKNGVIDFDEFCSIFGG